jgi:hypothetical protein
MFWRRKKKAVKEIKGDLFQYMVNKQHVPLHVLHNLRLVERDVEVVDKPAGLIMFLIFHLTAANEKYMTVDDYDSLDVYQKLVLYEGYKVLLVGIEDFRILDGKTVDCQDTEQGMASLVR